MIRDRQTDGQTPGEKQYVSQPFGGRHNKALTGCAVTEHLISAKFFYGEL